MTLSLCRELRGQVWTLSMIDGQIWMGHDRGLFSLNGGLPERIGEQRGVWTVKQYGDYLLAGTYTAYQSTGGMVPDGDFTSRWN